jgi:F0F1-type ATP synthase assembly protein I
VVKRKANPWAKAGAYTGLAFILPVSMYVCYLAGSWIDSKLGTGYWQIVGIIVGFAAGLLETLREARRIENGFRDS